MNSRREKPAFALNKTRHGNSTLICTSQIKLLLYIVPEPCQMRSCTTKQQKLSKQLCHCSRMTIFHLNSCCKNLIRWYRLSPQLQRVEVPRRSHKCQSQSKPLLPHYNPRFRSLFCKAQTCCRVRGVEPNAVLNIYVVSPRQQMSKVDDCK